KREQCPGRRIFLCSVVNLPAPCAKSFFASEAARRFAYHCAKMMQANGKIWSPDDAAVFRRCVFTQPWQLAKPSSRSRDHRNRRIQQSSYVLRGGGRRGVLNCHISSLKRFSIERSSIGSPVGSETR